MMCQCHGMLVSLFKAAAFFSWLTQLTKMLTRTFVQSRSTNKTAWRQRESSPLPRCAFDFTQRAPVPLWTSDVGNTRCVGQLSLLWWGCNWTNHFYMDLPTGLSDLGDSGLDDHLSKRPTELSLKQGWAGPFLEKELIENALKRRRAADLSFLWRLEREP